MVENQKRKSISSSLQQIHGMFKEIEGVMVSGFIEIRRDR